MAELESHCLELFPSFLRSLHEDALALAVLLEDESVDERVQRRAAGALNYLFRSLDLIPDGIEDLGFIDDAFILRTAMVEVADAAPADDESIVRRLAAEAKVIEEFMGSAFSRLVAYVDTLEQSVARGRSVDQIMQDTAVRAEFVREVKAWCEGFVPPTFSRDEKNLVKIRAFLDAKLPR
jgi:uncharacterized membrane protein YkvA (DUF1232 family)